MQVQEGLTSDRRNDVHSVALTFGSPDHQIRIFPARHRAYAPARKRVCNTVQRTVVAHVLGEEPWSSYRKCAVYFTCYKDYSSLFSQQLSIVALSVAATATYSFSAKVR
jgi:hypothetical protein